MSTKPTGDRDKSLPAAVTDELLDSYQQLSGALEHVNSYELPSMEAVGRIIDLCRALLFPGFVGASFPIVMNLLGPTPAYKRALSYYCISIYLRLYGGNAITGPCLPYCYKRIF